MVLTSPNSYSKDSRFEQSLEKGAERGVRNVRTEGGISEKEIKKKRNESVGSSLGRVSSFSTVFFLFPYSKE
jgi:hypothetical protein